MIACKECNREISSKAEACPHCGFRLQRHGCAKTFLHLLFLAFIVVPIAIYLASDPRKDSPPSPPTAADLEREQLRSAWHACERTIRSMLHDPGGAEFDDVPRYYVERLKDGGARVQISYRARNAFNALRHTTTECRLAQKGGAWSVLTIKSR